MHRLARQSPEMKRAARHEACIRHLRRRAPNAVFGLVELLKLKDANGHIKIPGMYDDAQAAHVGKA